MLDQLQKQSFQYFLQENNPANGLVPDKSAADSPASTAAVGFALACYPVGVERGLIKRSEALKRTRASVRFFAEASRKKSRDAPSEHGFFYHFLDLKSSQRTWRSEISTIDSALLLLGLFTAAQYFDGDAAPECEVRDLVDEIWRRMDWQWVLRSDGLISHGGKPERGFLKYGWCGYIESTGHARRRSRRLWRQSPAS
jgi:hypothetical protein